MPLPFRQQNTEDSPEEEWTPPSYAKPVEESSSEEWKPPSYAKAIEEVAKKPSVFSKIKEAIVHPKSFNPSGIKIPEKEALPNPSSEERIRAANELKDPGQGSYFKEHPSGKVEEPSLKQKADKFLGEVLSTDKHPYLKRILTSNNPGEESALPTTQEVGIKQPTTFAGGLAKGVYDEFARPLSSAAGVAGTIAFGNESPDLNEPTIARELPIGQADRRTNPLRDTTPQQDAVAIAQTREGIPRTAKNISTETGIPQPSVRRTISELKKKAEAPKVETPVAEEAPKPIIPDRLPPVDASDSDMQKFADSIKASQTEIPPATADERPLPIRRPDEPINRADVPREYALPDDAAVNAQEPPIVQRGITNDRLYNLARERQNMGADIPEPTQKANFNPFEKPKVEMPKLEWKPPSYAKAVEETQPTAEEIKTPETSPDGITEMSGGIGGIKPPKKVYPPSQGPAGPAVDKLFNAMGGTLEKRTQQDVINKVERAKRFAAFAGVKEEGVSGAAKSLGKLRGEFEKVNPGEGLDLNDREADSLFTAVKRAKISEGEKARGYTALFTILNGDRLPQRNELRILDDVFGNSFADRITQMHGGIGAVGLKLSKVANTMKSMQNALSLAAPLRHGAGLIYKKEFYPAFVDMFKFFGNKEYFDSSMQAMQEHPNYPKFKEAGGFFAKSGSLLNSEEEFLNSYVGDLPRATGIPQAVGASQRGYVGFLNKLRFDVFNSMTKKAEGLGTKLFTEVGDQVVASKEAKAITNFINNATGRGDLGSLNKVTNELNLLLWSPRMIASRVQMFANPKIYMDLPKGMRLEGMKSLLGIASMGLMVNGLASLGGAKVGTNILSTDFMKSRFGNKVIDPNAGLQQYVVAAARFLKGKTDSSQPTSRMEIAGRFLANKESPAASLAHTMLTAKFTGKSDDPATAGNLTTEYGEKTNIQSQIGKQYIPIFLQDLADLAQSEPDWSKDIGLDVAMGAASLAGMAQDYPEKKHGLSLGKMRGLKLNKLQ
jgi:hypothetical protein